MKEHTFEPALDKRLCQNILHSLNESGQPPRFGARKLSVGFEPKLDDLKTQYLSTLLPAYEGSDGSGATKFIVGNYGDGKTLFIRAVQETAWEQDFITSFVELSQDECPLDDAAKIYASIASNVQAPPTSASEVEKYTGIDQTLERLLDRIVPGIFSGTADDMTKELAETWVNSTLRNTPCDSLAYRELWVRHLNAKIKGDEDTMRITSACLRGESVPNADLVKIGVYEKLDKSNGFRWLRSMCQLIQRAEMAQGTALLFDEARRSLSLMSVRAQKIACENLLSLINYCSRGQYPGTIFLYAVMPTFFTDFADNYPALQQRCGPNMRIDIRELGIREQDLLKKIGERITELFQAAEGSKALDRELLKKNLKVTADAAYKHSMGTGTRRLFTKVWISVLKDSKNGGPELDATNIENYIHAAKDSVVDSEKSTVESEGE